MKDDIELKSRLWKKVQDLYGKRDTYPQPFCHMTEADHKEMVVLIEKQKDHFVYLGLTNQIFRAILNDQFQDATAILDAVYQLNHGWTNKNAVNLGLIRDSGRIMSLKLCSVLTQTLVKLSKKEDMDQNGNKVIEVIVLLLQPLS